MKKLKQLLPETEEGYRWESISFSSTSWKRVPYDECPNCKKHNCRKIITFNVRRTLFFNRIKSVDGVEIFDFCENCQYETDKDCYSVEEWERKKKTTRIKAQN